MLVYNCGIFFYNLFIRFASLFNHKARLWVRGRKDIFIQIEKTLKQKIKPGSSITWFHCASLGEFEQGRPVLENLKDKGHTIVLTFFSPSGYEMRKDYEHADAVFYLPMDFKRNAKRFVEAINPSAAIFVKYEFWLNYLEVLHSKKIPFYLVSGVFRPSQHFFKWYGSSFFKALKNFRVLFVQDQNSLELLQQHGLTNGSLAGDTRFDRVLEIVRNKKTFSEIEKFCAGKQVIMAGSSWPKDEELLLGAFAKLKQTSPDLKLMLVPHEIDAASLTATMGRVKASGYAFSKYTDSSFNGDIVVIDTMGMLSQLYQYATVAYVGGGFDNGIHNILEVFAHGVPVAFGPNYHKFVEAHEARQFQIGKPVHNEAELFAFMSELISNEEKRRSISRDIADYMEKRAGATDKIVRKLISLT